MDPLLRLLQQMAQSIGLRLDAGETATLNQQLEYVKARTYDVRYPTMIGRSLVPEDTSIPAAAETVTYEQWDHYAIAELLTNYSTDFKEVGVSVKEFTSRVHGLGNFYSFSIQDLRRAMMSGARLPERKAKAARRGIELAIDDIIAFGHPQTQMKGLLNNSNVTILTAANDGTATEWVTGRTTPKTPALIQKDMAQTVTYVWTTTKQIHRPNTIVMPTVEYGHISQTAVGSDNNQTTILSNFLGNNPAIGQIIPWYKLDTADAAGTGPRMLSYEKTDEVLDLALPVDFEQFPPQAVKLSFETYCHARIGGVKMYYPLAVVYMDGV
jgi:hypothetical protein